MLLIEKLVTILSFWILVKASFQFSLLLSWFYTELLHRHRYNFIILNFLNFKTAPLENNNIFTITSYIHTLQQYRFLPMH